MASCSPPRRLPIEDLTPDEAKAAKECAKVLIHIGQTILERLPPLEVGGRALGLHGFRLDVVAAEGVLAELKTLAGL